MERQGSISRVRKYASAATLLVAASCAAGVKSNTVDRTGHHIDITSTTVSTNPSFVLPAETLPVNTMVEEPTTMLSPETLLPDTTTTTTEVTPSTTQALGGYGCKAAITYLEAAAPLGTEIICPANPEITRDEHGVTHQAMSCINNDQYCPNKMLIAIVDPCPQAYLNEAENIWALKNLIGARTLDPTILDDLTIDLHGHC